MAPRFRTVPSTANQPTNPYQPAALSVLSRARRETWVQRSLVSRASERMPLSDVAGLLLSGCDCVVGHVTRTGSAAASVFDNFDPKAVFDNFVSPRFLEPARGMLVRGYAWVEAITRVPPSALLHSDARAKRLARTSRGAKHAGLRGVSHARALLRAAPSAPSHAQIWCV